VRLVRPEKPLARARMKSQLKSFNIGLGLTVTFVVLVGLILAGNGLLVWQFQIARMQTERLNGGNQQVIAVLRLQEELLSFHQQLDELVHSRDARRLISEAEPLRKTFLEQIQQTRNTVTHLPSETRVDPAFLPTLDAIAIDLPSQVDAVTALAGLGDWDVVRTRLAKSMRLLETPISILVKSIDQGSSQELTNAMASIRDVQQRILIIVQLMAISTFSIAAFLGWAITRRIVELRQEERLSERMRIASEVHDNLLQGIISAKMLVQVAVDQVPVDSPAGAVLARLAKITEQVIEEGRNTLRGFRLSAGDDQDLQHAFFRVQQELRLDKEIDCRVEVKGHPKALRPVIRHDVYAIGREALVNSFRHSGARRVEVDLEYAGQLRVIVRDDGCGIESRLLQISRDGHFGLSVMRERAERIGAKLKLLSRPGTGTEVELCVPGSIAFESPPSNPPFKWLAGLYRRNAAKAGTAANGEKHTRAR
jgi:signal transduction histidine kinase